MSATSAFIERLKGQKGLLLIIITAALGLLLLALSSAGTDGGAENATEAVGEAVFDRERLEERVAAMIERMEGIGGVSVMLTLDCSSETVYARNGSESVGAQYVVIDGKDGDVCVPVKIVEPKLRGAAVICRGGDDADVQLRITSMLSALFGLASNRIYVSG